MGIDGASIEWVGSSIREKSALADLDERSAPRWGDERSEESISPGARPGCVPVPVVCSRWRRVVTSPLATPCKRLMTCTIASSL